ncbi:hypothetical protein H9L39_12889 [Fusarium oxysporum f. sp. albedinis]|nr:hypothetical protein H9L39_12889 [Fusarium oxysporum f. sp. albedinis]
MRMRSKASALALRERQVDVVEVWDVERERMRGSGDRRLFVPRRPVPVPRGKDWAGWAKF